MPAPLRRILAIARKESLQAMRDPSTHVIAFLLPVVLLFFFAYALSLDTKNIALGLVLESDDAEAQSLAAAFAGSRYFSVHPARDRREVEPELLAGRLRAIAVIPQDFSARLHRGDGEGIVQILTDGSQPNTAAFAANYARGVLTNWLAQKTGAATPVIAIAPRFWFNPEIDSRRALVPGAIAVIMTMIGAMLTAMVIAREWERGTLEGLFSTPARVPEILIGKLLPYFVLGMTAMTFGAALAVGFFDVPLRGSVWLLFALSAVFLIPALGQGLLISAIAKNQFIAAQMALITAFLPAFLLSGFLFELSSMPAPIRALSAIVPARHFNAALQTVFLVGDIWPLIFPSVLALLAIGAVFFAAALSKTRKRL